MDGNLSTTQLVVASKRGNNEALGRLLEQYRGFLLMLAHRYLSERLRRRMETLLRGWVASGGSPVSAASSAAT